MLNVKLTIEYDGTNFAGWQVQPNQVTIQSEIEKAIKQITGRVVKIIASGRTDSGVHARGQVANFKIDQDINFKTLARSLNAVLPEGIAILDAQPVVNDFHARHSAISKSYRYIILNRQAPPTIESGYVWHYPWELNEQKLTKAMQDLVGQHDFSAFRAADCANKEVIKEIYSFNLHRENDFLIFDISGSGFLKYMVRNIVGTVVEYGKEQQPLLTLQEILISKDRKQAGQTAPAEGLYLMKVSYPVLPAGH